MLRRIRRKNENYCCRRGLCCLPLAVLLAQHHEVTVITTTPKKAERLNLFISPIQDYEIERCFAESKAGTRKLSLTNTVDKFAAYRSAEIVVIACPTITTMWVSSTIPALLRTPSSVC